MKGKIKNSVRRILIEYYAANQITTLTQIPCSPTCQDCVRYTEIYAQAIAEGREKFCPELLTILNDHHKEQIIKAVCLNATRSIGREREKAIVS